ncbi:MAG TPA: TetR family transcriptional regulator, partial [Colwellia sp.]|nr:TetR family transcriptional regulator [Colwellia sp.]
MKNTEEKSKYHHGDLRETLLLVATEMLQESGIKEVSLRKLASRVGVSRTAPYHHFKDKNAL